MNLEERESPETKAVKLGFLCCCQRAPNDGFVGGLLVTNDGGLPLEFRSTEPILPTTGQRVLYGQSLEAYVKSSLIAHTLFSGSKETPEVLLTDEELLLGLREQVTVPVLFVTSREGLLVEQKNTLSMESDRFRSISLRSHPEYQDDLATAQKMLAGPAKKMDLLDPFSRVHEALKLVLTK